MNIEHGMSNFEVINYPVCLGIFLHSTFTILCWIFEVALPATSHPLKRFVWGGTGSGR